MNAGLESPKTGRQIDGAQARDLNVRSYSDVFAPGFTTRVEPSENLTVKVPSAERKNWGGGDRNARGCEAKVSNARLRDSLVGAEKLFPNSGFGRRKAGTSSTRRGFAEGAENCCC